MDLQTLIMEHFRRQIDDEALPYLWSDDEALAYAIAAQDMFVRLTGGISDVTVPAAAVGTPPTRLPDLAVTLDDPWATLSPYVLRLRSGRLLTSGVDIDFINEGDLATVPTRDYGWTRGLSLDDTDIGEVRFGILGLRENYVRWLRVPDTADTCRCHVYRLPYPRITNEQDTLEIAEHHHLDLVKWMKHLAYSKQDAEARDDKKAKEYEEAFKAYCELARRETQRQRSKPRVVKYRGL